MASILGIWRHLSSPGAAASAGTSQDLANSATSCLIWEAMPTPRRLVALLLVLATAPAILRASPQLDAWVAALRARRGEAPAEEAAAAPSPATTAPPPLVEELRFASGELVRGRLMEMKGGVVTFSGFRMPAIQADLAALADVVTTGPMVIFMDSGTELVGPLRANGDPASFEVLTEVGPVRAPKDQLTRIASPAQLEAERRKLEERATERLGKWWKGYIDVGLTNSVGNTETSETKVQLEATRTTTLDKLRLNVYTQQADAAGKTTVDKTYGEANLQVDLREDFFYFLQGRLETDKVRKLDLRSTIGAGFGKKLVKGRNLKLDAGLGYSFVREDFSSGTEQSSGTLLATLDLDWGISRQLSLEEHVSANPDFSKDDLLLKTQTTLKSRLDENLSLVLGYLYNYDRVPPAGADRRDATLTLGLRRNF